MPVLSSLRYLWRRYAASPRLSRLMACIATVAPEPARVPRNVN